MTAIQGDAPAAWMRRWFFDGIKPMTLPKKFRPRGWFFLEVTVNKCFEDDVPLFSPSPPEPPQ